MSIANFQISVQLCVYICTDIWKWAMGQGAPIFHKKNQQFSSPDLSALLLPGLFPDSLLEARSRPPSHLHSRAWTISMIKMIIMIIMIQIIRNHYSARVLPVISRACTIKQSALISTAQDGLYWPLVYIDKINKTVLIYHKPPLCNDSNHCIDNID